MEKRKRTRERLCRIFRIIYIHIYIYIHEPNEMKTKWQYFEGFPLCWAKCCTKSAIWANLLSYLSVSVSVTIFPFSCLAISSLFTFSIWVCVFLVGMFYPKLIHSDGIAFRYCNYCCYCLCCFFLYECFVVVVDLRFCIPCRPSELNELAQNKPNFVYTLSKYNCENERCKRVRWQEDKQSDIRELHRMYGILREK